MGSYMVGKLAPYPINFNRGLVKYVPGRSYFLSVPSQNGDKIVTSPPPSQLLNDSLQNNKGAGSEAQGTQCLSRNCRCRKSVSSLSRLIKLFRNKYH